MEEQDMDQQDALMRPKAKLNMVENAISSQPKSIFKQRELLQITKENLEDPSLSYELTSASQRGICLLFNHHEFDKRTGQSRRDGTNVDADCMKKIFTILRYEVKRYTNASTEQYAKAIEEVRSMDHSAFDSFICIILSHGDNGHIYTYDSSISVDHIVAQFRGDLCPNLVGKPKLFFIQACRGSSFDQGATKFESDDAGDKLTYKLPIEADVLVSNSTFPGYFAWRNSQQGSWYIQELYKTLVADHSAQIHRDINTLLTVVARRVAVLYESNTGMIQSHGKKQMTSCTSTLTKLCYLTGKPLGN